MLSPLRNRFGIPGVISVIALVFAMFGGAYAATNGNPLAGVSKQERQQKKSKAKQGPRGPRGKAGPAGSAGPQGPAGAKGNDGANGSAGSNGSNGSNGKNAETASFGGALHGCTEGGIEVKSASPVVYVCNGKKGVQGEPGPLVETLPGGKTLTGHWGFGGTEGTHGEAVISFPFPLSSAPDLYFNDTIIWKQGGALEVIVTTEQEEEWEDNCSGEASEPTAAAGSLCVYVATESQASFDTVNALFHGALEAPTPFGTQLPVTTLSGEYGVINGSWAVTAAG